MPRWFTVNAASGQTTLKLDSQSHGTVQFTVKNVSGGSIDGRAVLVSLPVTTPPSGPVQNGWVKVDGTVNRHFDKDKEEVFTVKVALPPKGATAGDYTFRLDVLNEATPDVGDSSQAIKFTVPPPTKVSGPGFKWWIPVVIVLVLAVAGVTTWLLLRNRGIVVPNLVGMAFDDASTQVKGKLTLQRTDQPNPDPKNINKIIDQQPASGARVPVNTPIKVTVGVAMHVLPLPPRVPVFEPHPVEQKPPAPPHAVEPVRR
jgi:beta-lactam-binding protein with PASTA domain